MHVYSAQLIVCRRKVWVQLDDVFECLLRLRPLLICLIDLAQFEGRIRRLWLQLGPAVMRL